MSELSANERCVSDLALDEWLAAELEPAAGERVASHVASCSRCSARKAERDRDREAFLQRAPSFDAHAGLARGGPPGLRHGVRAGVHRGWLAGATGALALAASVWLFAGVPPGADPTTRSKGGPHIGFFVKHGERVARGISGQSVYPGDELRFTYTSSREAYLALVNVDAGGASPYFPSAGTQAVHIAKGSDVALDFSVELDARLGTERVYAMFCAQPFPIEPVRAALQVSPAAGPAAAQGCEVDVVALHKQAPP